MIGWDQLVSYAPLLLAGAWTTLWLTLATMALGFLVALPVGLCRDARAWPLRAFAAGFVFLFRGAPLLALLFFVYFGAPDVPLIRRTWLWTLFREPLFCAVLALSLNSAGYLTEIVAGALRAVPRGEVEAARALGLRPIHVFRFVQWPNAVRAAIRSYGNEVVFIIKATSVASLVTVPDIMAAAGRIYYQTFDTVTPWLLAGGFYLLLVSALSAFVRWVERQTAVPGR